MKSANVIYYKTMDPRESPELDALYWALRDQTTEVTITTSFYKRNWRAIYTLPVSSNRKAEMEKIFSLLNSPSNPLSSRENQNFIREKGLRHTSMSVGDIIRIQYRYYIVANSGFLRLRIVE